MKLKSRFLSLSALLALGMATTAWADDEIVNVKLQGNAQEGYYVNMPAPASNSGTTRTGVLVIPENVKSFHVYDDGGKDNPFTSHACYGKTCAVHLQLTAPEGCRFRWSGSINTYELSSPYTTGHKGVVEIYNGTDASSSSVSHGDGYASIGEKTSTGRDIYILFSRTDAYATGDNGPGLDLLVEVNIPNMNVVEGGVSNNSYTVSAAANQFNYQVNKEIGDIDNTTTITAPEGYVIYLEGGATVYENGSVAVYDGASTNATKLLEKTGPSTTDNVITSGNTITFRATTTGSGMVDVMRLPVHIVKKSTSLSTDGVEIFEDVEDYKVAKISDIEEGTVSIPAAVEVDAIIYDRTFKANTKETIVLPFSLPEGATTNAKFYYLRKVVQQENVCAWMATLKRVSSPKANKPYVIVIDNNETELRIDLKGGKATFQTTETVEYSDQTGNWIFKGLYQDKIWGDNDNEIGLAYALAKDDDANGHFSAGQFVKIGAKSSAAPMRAYMRKADETVRLSRPLAMGEVSSIEDMPEVIDVELVDEDDKPMAIGRMNTVTGAIKIDRWFDLKGRSTNHKPTTKGVFFNKKGIAK